MRGLHPLDAGNTCSKRAMVTDALSCSSEIRLVSVHSMHALPSLLTFLSESLPFMHENNYFRVAFACWIGGNACVFSRLFCLLSYSSALHTDSNGT